VGAIRDRIATTCLSRDELVIVTVRDEELRWLWRVAGQVGWSERLIDKMLRECVIGVSLGYLREFFDYPKPELSFFYEHIQNANQGILDEALQTFL
jgi:hypothetical protein